MPSSNLAISVRNLGSVRIKNYCPKCFWYLLKVRFQPPFKFAGNLFRDAENCEKAILGYFLDKDGRLPKPFAPVCDCAARIEYPRHWSKFLYTHKSGVDLYGVPDEILEREDGTLCVIDHKTAHFREDDPFHEQYETQVIGYGNIAEKGLGLGKVTLGALLYWDAQVKDVEDDPAGHYNKGTVWMPLAVKPLEVKIDYRVLDPAIDELKAVVKAKNPPEGRVGCKDCKKLDLLLAIEQQMRQQDRALVRENECRDHIRRELKQRTFERDDYLRGLLKEFEAKGEEIFSADGMVASWEFPDLDDE